MSTGLQREPPVRADEPVVSIETSKAVEYPLPHSTNVRRVFVDNATTPPTFWVGNNEGAAIIKLELPN